MEHLLAQGDKGEAALEKMADRWLSQQKHGEEEQGKKRQFITAWFLASHTPLLALASGGIKDTMAPKSLALLALLLLGYASCLYFVIRAALPGSFEATAMEAAFPAESQHFKDPDAYQLRLAQHEWQIKIRNDVRLENRGVELRRAIFALAIWTTMILMYITCRQIWR